jgi:hypothetical protein
MTRASFLLADVVPLHGTTVSSIPERLTGPNRHAFILGMHESNQSVDGLRAVITSKFAYFYSDLRPIAGVSALTGFPGR